MSDQLALLPGRLLAHLELALAALALAIALGVPLGVAVTRRRALETPILGAASAIQTIPSLALLAVMVPLLAALGGVTAAAFGVALSSIGYAPALVALTLYSLLPVLRNTVAGIRSVDPALREAAQGVGMTPRQQLLRVELSLAMPVVVAGVRTAAVFAVGTATLSTPVGATSLGDFIFSGLQTRNGAAVLVGCAAAAALALLLDGLLGGLERGLRERRRPLAGLALAALAALGVGTAGAAVWRRAGPEPALRIGAKPFTEQYVLAEILAQWIERRAGADAARIGSLGSTVAFDALRSGAIDAYVEYSGTVWATLMRRTDVPPRGEVLAEMERWLAREHGVAVAAALGFDNTYALGVRGADARARGLRRIGDLTPLAPRLAIAGDFEFFARPEWQALANAYGLRFRARRTMDPSLMYRALVAGEVDVISAYSTDGRLAALDVVLLEDGKGVIPPYDAVVLASPSLPDARPRVWEALRELAGRIDRARMRQMNLAVDGEGRSPREVAAAFVDALAEAAARP